MVILLLGLIIFLCYGQVISHQFVWDSEHIFNNEQLRAFTWANTAWIFTHPIIANWHPISWLSHTLDFVLFGWSPGGHHLANLFIHFLNSILVFHLVKLLASFLMPDVRKAYLIAALSAVFFVIHPLRVESVAWVAARKDLLYSFFTLLSILTYIYYRKQPSIDVSRRWYIISLGFFILALLSKSMAVTLPALLILLDGFILRRAEIPERLTRVSDWTQAFRLLMPDKIVYFILTALIILTTILTQTQALSTESLSLTQALQTAIRSVALYIYHLFVPLNLSPFYPFPPLEELGEAMFWLPSLAAILAISLLGIILAFKGRTLLLCCWLLYLVSLSPASGIIHVGSATAADRYTYLTLLPLLVLISTFLVNAYLKYPKVRSVTLSLVLFALLSLGLLTHAQVGIWKTPISLWSHVLKLYPNAALAHRNISTSYILIGEYDEALNHLETISKKGWNVDKELAGTLALAGNIVRARDLFEKMIISGQYSEEDTQVFKSEIKRLDALQQATGIPH